MSIWESSEEEARLSLYGEASKGLGRELGSAGEGVFIYVITQPLGYATCLTEPSLYNRVES